MAILTLVLVVTAVLWRSHEPAPANGRVVSPERTAKAEPRLSSKEAREQLGRLIDGRLKAPPLDEENRDARSRYYKTTSDWLAALSVSDCAALIDSDADHKSDILDRLYRRYGELDPKGAIARLDGLSSSSYQDRSYADYFRSYVIDGWAKTDPAEAWVYYRSLDREDGESPLGHNADNFVRDLFSSWSKRDGEAAYAAISAARGREVPEATIGYYGGLPGSVDFSKEASRLSEVLEGGYGPLRQNWQWDDNAARPERVLPLLLTRSWANHDPDAALAWWIELAPHDPETEVASKDTRDFWTGWFVASWVGEWDAGAESYSPDSALRWVEVHADLLQSSGFAEKALPSLVALRPEASITLISRIESAEQQSYRLAEYVQPPAFQGEDRYRRQVPSNLLDPSLVESSLSRFHFDETQTTRVREAIQKRRTYDATKPPPAPSVW